VGRGTVGPRWPGTDDDPGLLQHTTLRRLKEEEREFINNANFEHIVKISRERAATEEASLLLMVAERQKLLELNTQCQAEATAREQARFA
jgi:hypothetical protein